MNQDNMKVTTEILKEEAEYQTLKRLEEAAADKGDAQRAEALRIARIRTRLAKDGKLTEPRDGAILEGEIAEKHGEKAETERTTRTLSKGTAKEASEGEKAAKEVEKKTESK